MNEFLNAYSMTRNQGRQDMADMERARDQGQRRSAARLMTGRDYAGAARALAETGDLAGVSALGAQGRGQQIAPLLRDGKTDEALQIPGLTVEEMSGIQTFAQRADERERKLKADELELYGSIAAGLMNVPQEQRAAEVARIAPIIDVDPATITPEMLTDGGLQSLIARSMGAAEYLKLQRPQATPFGIIYPPGANPAPSAAAPQGGPAVGQRATNPNDPSAPALVWSGTAWELEGSARPKPASPTGGAERNQTPTVSFGSTTEAQTHIRRLVPGVQFNSGFRTPADNARVKGAKRSYHLSGRAWDLDPPAGMTTAQLAARMKQAGFRVLDEGDHVHVSW